MAKCRIRLRCGPREKWRCPARLPRSGSGLSRTGRTAGADVSHTRSIAESPRGGVVGDVEILGPGRALRISGKKLRSRPTVCHRTARDRKSTRLNSSHGYISYAVFCLKKKKSL